MRKLNKALLIAVPMTLAMAFTSFAGQWNYDMNGWWYGTDDGGYLDDGWHWLDGNEEGIAECYYFGHDGYMVNDHGYADGYTVDDNGAWTINGAVQTRDASTL